MQHICTETHDFDISPIIAATPGDETTKTGQTAPRAGLTAIHSKSGRTAREAGLTAVPGLRRIKAWKTENLLEFSNQ